MADVERYVNCSSSGGDGTTRNESGATAAYASLSSWEANEGADLVTATQTHRVRCASGSSNNADTTACIINGFTTNATYYYTVQGDDGDSTGKYDGDSNWSTSHYRLSVSAGGSDSLDVTGTGAVIDGIQAELSSGTNFRAAITYRSLITIKNCRIQYAGSGNQYGLEGDSGSRGSVLINNIVEGSFGVGIRLNHAGSPAHELYNNTVSGCTTGVDFSVNFVQATLKNNVSFNNSDDFDTTAGSLTLTWDSNASDDGDGTNAISLNENASGEWTAAFTSYSTGDFSVKDTGSALYNVGVGNGSDSSIPTADINANDRGTGTTCDVGAFEYVAAGGGATGKSNPINGPIFGPIAGPIGM